MGSRYSIETVFKALTGQYTGPVKQMQSLNKRVTKQFRQDFAKAQRQVQNFGRSFKQNFTNAIKMGAFVAAGSLAVGLGIATREFIQYDQAITSASAKFKDLNLSTEQGQRSLQKLKKVARDVGAATQFSATEAAAGLDYLAMAGFTSEQAMVSLLPVVDLATVANVDLARATDIASDALGAFGLMTEDTNQLQTNFARLNDVMAKTMTSTNTDMESMFEAMKKGAPTFTAAGQSLESFNALLGIMASSGVKGAESGTQLRNIMLRLSKPTGEASELLDTLGIRTQDSKGNFLDVIDILEQFEKATKSMGTQQKSAALSTIFGARAVTGINILLKAGTKDMRLFREMLEKSQGAAKKMAEIMRSSLAARLSILKSSAIELGFKFVEAFEKHGSTGLKKFTEIVQKFNPEPIIKGVKIFVKILIVMWKILKPFLPIILGIVAAWKAYQLILIIAAAQQMIMNAVMTANPVGLIITGIGILIGLVVLMVIHWKKIVNWLKIAWNWFVKTYDIIKGLAFVFGGPLAAPIVITIELVRNLIKYWGYLTDAFKSEGILGGIIAIGKVILTSILAPIESLFNLIGKIPAVGAKFKEWGLNIGEFRSGMFESQSPVTQGQQYAYSKEEKIQKGELTIKGDTDKIETPKQSSSNWYVIQKQRSGAF